LIKKSEKYSIGEGNKQIYAWKEADSFSFSTAEEEEILRNFLFVYPIEQNRKMKDKLSYKKKQNTKSNSG
jgi:hypothetical protein